MERVVLDTSFLIDLQNERRRRGAPRGAIDFLRAHPELELLLPAVALGEYLEGFDDPDGPAAQAVVAPLRVLAITHEVARLYALTTRALRASRRLIGTNDIWIGCTALAADAPLLTRNVGDFRRIPGLEVVSYGP